MIRETRNWHERQIGIAFHLCIYGKKMENRKISFL